MSDYNSAHTMEYGSWINREAALKDITPNELEKKIDITPIKVSDWRIAGGSKKFAINEFNELAEDYDAITDLKEGLSGIGFLGPLGEEYFIHGTGIKFK